MSDVNGTVTSEPNAMAEEQMDLGDKRERRPDAQPTLNVAALDLT